jgi:MFS family permease
VMNMAGSLSASASPIVFGFLAEKGSWSAPFFITALILLAGSLIWTLLINPEVSVVD